MTPPALQGKCLCGGVRYALTAPVDTLTICHCHQCRRANGSAFHIVLVAPVEALVFDGQPTLAEFQSSPGKFRAFCTGCGAPVYSRRDETPALYRLRAGLIADLPAPSDLRQQHREEAWPWLGQVAALVGDQADGVTGA